MNLNALKLHLIQQLLATDDEETLRRVQTFFNELGLQEPEPTEGENTVREGAVAYGITEPEDDLTEEELEELVRRRADRLSGKSIGISVEESMRQLRSAQARDEAV